MKELGGDPTPGGFRAEDSDPERGGARADEESDPERGGPRADEDTFSAGMRPGSFAGRPRRGRVRSIALPFVLFVLTVLSTTLAHGPAYSFTLMSILVAHEMGHYVAARHHRVPASLPYFIPLPGIALLGTLGAVIGMRSDQATRNQLFDIGAAGPICGFIVAVPAMIIGIRLSRVVPLDDGTPILFFGDSILSAALLQIVGPEIPIGHDLGAHPVMIAAWAGFFVTSLNLLPVGQFDGGHVLYAWSPERANAWMKNVHRVLVVLGTLGLLLYAPAILRAILDAFGRGQLISLELLEETRPFYRWVTPGFLVIALLARYAVGIRHPPVRESERPLSPRRRVLAFACLVIWAMTFMPSPAWTDRPWL